MELDGIDKDFTEAFRRCYNNNKRDIMQVINRTLTNPVVDHYSVEARGDFIVVRLKILGYDFGISCVNTLDVSEFDYRFGREFDKCCRDACVKAKFNQTLPQDFIAMTRRINKIESDNIRLTQTVKILSDELESIKKQLAEKTEKKKK